MPEDLCACDQSAPPDLEAWRAEAGASLAMANAATPAPWTWDGLEQLVSGPAVVLYPCEVWHDTIEIQGTDADKAFTSAARTGWPRDAARVGVLCAEVERLRARIAEQDAILEDHKHAAWERSERD